MRSRGGLLTVHVHSVQEDEAQSEFSEIQIRIRLPRYTPATGSGRPHCSVL